MAYNTWLLRACLSHTVDNSAAGAFADVTWLYYYFFIAIIINYFQYDKTILKANSNRIITLAAICVSIHYIVDLYVWVEGCLHDTEYQRIETSNIVSVNLANTNVLPAT